jgi:acyl transferase domain-containing protein
MDIRTTGTGIAVVGIGCWYPGARGPRELWENVLGRRRQFRRVPETRLPLEEYYDPDPAAPDKTYGRKAAVIDGFTFDWVGNRIPKKTYESTDVVQWLALEVARQALADARHEHDSSPRERTGVIVGNTLTGEHTRANTMRLRWPYVRRAMRAAGARRKLPARVLGELVEAMEEIYKSSFAPTTEDTLAGGLSNTIAGRICNSFDFHGGGYTVDGACSSSLLAICTAADRLTAGDLDVALAGGVDISLDTFELVGFAKTGALSPDDMRVYDRRGNGFIPGEGCGFVVLKRIEDAEAAGDAVYAIIRGWGISSDGKGGLTAPSRDGQATAIRRAYARAGYGPERLDFVEGHGTGTKVGDKVELEALAQAMRLSSDGQVTPRSCGMTSFKSIVGHTKAAAGVGAFIKATLAVNRRVLPPTAGCERPHTAFETTARGLYPILLGEVVDPSWTLHAGVSAMGFGGINTHVTLESGGLSLAKVAPTIDERALLATHQETEVFVLGSDTVAELLERLTSLSRTAELLSQAELTDLAAKLGAEITGATPIRAAVIAVTPEDLAERLLAVAADLRRNPLRSGEVRSGPQRDWWVSDRVRPVRVGFLLPGQGSQQLSMARTLVERSVRARDLVARVDRGHLEKDGMPLSSKIFRPIDRASGPDEVEQWTRDLSRTEAAQPAVCLASLLYARHLANLGVHPAVVAGHSLGELTAFHLAGLFDEETFMALATARGRAMAVTADCPGAMASFACSSAEVELIIGPLGDEVTMANLNSPRQTVISGTETAVLEAIRFATERGVSARRLAVSDAFHSPRMTAAAERFKVDPSWPERPGHLAVKLLSGMTGGPVESGTDLRQHFAAQMVGRVKFVDLVEQMRRECDVMIEVGPGGVLSGLVTEIVGPNGPACLPVASRPSADRDLNVALAYCFAHGIDVRWPVLYEGRLVRPFVEPSERVFIDNPCERPFPEPQVLEEGPIIETAIAGKVESALLEATGVSPEELQSYFTQRQGFIAEVVKADLRSLQGMLSLPAAAPLSPARTIVEAVPMIAKPITPCAGSLGLESHLLDLAALQTGFPRDSITLETRLLDDLNLDSIKAAELVASAAKQWGVAGRLDPSAMANASLEEVATAIGAAVAGQAQPVEPIESSPSTAPTVTDSLVSVLDYSMVWVRNFVIEYVPDAA